MKNPFRTDQNKTQILWKEIRFRRFRIRENMWWTRYSMWFSPPLTLLMNPTCLLWLKKTKIPRPLDWDRPRIIPLPAPPPSRPHTTTPDPNNCEQSTKLPVKTRKLTATSIRFLSHIWRNCRFVKLCTWVANLHKNSGLCNIMFLSPSTRTRASSVHSSVPPQFIYLLMYIINNWLKIKRIELADKNLKFQRHPFFSSNCNVQFFH